LLKRSVVNVETDNQTGGTKMISVNRIFFAGAVISAAAAVFMASGCGVAGASGMQRAAEVRVATTLEAGSPKMIVSGPARLLHVDVRGHQALSIYAVKRDASGGANCANAARSGARALRQAASTELNLQVQDDEAICLANEAGTAPKVDVSWHARRGAATPIEIGHAFASN
jgi:hypothetical protein